MNQETLAIPDTEDDASIQEREIRDYLLNHLDFFDNNPDLLATITLPHDSGQAVSLIERQVSVLRERNMEMRHRLNNMLETARENDRLFERTKRLILNLLDAENIEEINKNLNSSLSADFEIEFHSLVLIGNQNHPTLKSATFNQAQQEVSSLLRSNRPLCGTLRDTELSFLFGDDQATKIGSVAAVPLGRGKTIGFLALGNSDPQFYRSSMGTLFLSQIADILTRLIPKYTD